MSTGMQVETTRQTNGRHVASWEDDVAQGLEEAATWPGTGTAHSIH